MNQEIASRDMRALLQASAVQPQLIDCLIEASEWSEPDTVPNLNALRQRLARHGKAGIIVSTRFRNVIVNWDKALQAALQVGGTAAGAGTLAQAVQTAWATGAVAPALPTVAILATIAGLLVGWRAIRELADVPLSDDHAMVVYYLWVTRKDQKTTLADVHNDLDARLDADNVSRILTDLADLGLIHFGLFSEIELRTYLVLAGS